MDSFTIGNPDAEGDVVACELRELEQRQSELDLYDRAVDEHVRGPGIATALITILEHIGKAAGACKGGR